MKKITFILFGLIGIISFAHAQSMGDYRSAGSGNWNDATKWEMYDGTIWVNTGQYPGQNPGSGAVTIMISHEIKLAATVPYPVASLLVDQFTNVSINEIGALYFSSITPVSLIVSGKVAIHGDLMIEDQPGAKAHTLSVGGGLEIGTKVYDDCSSYTFTPANFQTRNQDDKLSIVFTGAGLIDCDQSGIEFQDITFNGDLFTVITPVYIDGSATFIKGIVTPISYNSPGSRNGDCQYYYSYDGQITFNDNATASGASAASFIDGPVWKWGNDPFTFPIGNVNVYAPLTISAPPDQNSLISAQYQRANPTSIGQVSDTGLFNISRCEYWSLDKGSIPLDVTVGWSSASGCDSSPYISNVSQVTMANSGSIPWNWDRHSGSGSGTPTNGSVIWSGTTSSGFFTLANLGSSCHPPTGLNTINISYHSATLSWSPVSGFTSASYDLDYKADTSTAWLNAITATTSTSLTITGLGSGTSYVWRIRTNCSSSTSQYSQTFFHTLCETPSGLTSTNITVTSAILNWKPVSNATNYTVEYKQSASPTWTTAVSGLNGSNYTLNGLLNATAYDWRVTPSCNGQLGNFAQATFTTLTPVCNDLNEPNNIASQAKAINVGVTISGGISSATDVDWYRVSITDNSNTNLKVTLGNLAADYDLFVYNKNLVLLGSSINSSTADEVVVYNTRARNMTYFIRVIGKNGAYNTTICYALLVQASGKAQTATRIGVQAKEIAEIPDNDVIYPNPVSNVVWLHFRAEVSGQAQIQFLNSTGQLSGHFVFNISKGFNQLEIPVSNLSPGMYLLRITNDQCNQCTLVRKFVIAR